MLGRILHSSTPAPVYADLLVGNDTRDDAAVYALDADRAVLSTTDFFLPIVDDPVDFGHIAAANALSDVYAMGGRPLMAIGILGWPIDKLPAEVANGVIEGGRRACAEAGIPLAGGHSIDNPEPLFGLAVTGLVDRARLKTNAGGQAGDRLFLTKPLGIGMLTTAVKRGAVRPGDFERAVASMRRLNHVGAELAEIPGVHALTDVTGFGLLGHLTEVAGAAGLGAVLDLAAVPTLTDLDPYLDDGVIPGGTRRNWSAYAAHVGGGVPDRVWQVLCDPQTNGGLLVAASPDAVRDVQRLLAAGGWHAEPIGTLEAARPGLPAIRLR